MHNIFYHNVLFLQTAQRVNITSLTTGNDLSNLVDLGNGSNTLISDQNDPFFHVTSIVLNDDLVLYKDWSCVTVDLHAHIGEIIRLEFLNRDCTGGKHFGYTYLDNICVGCPGGNVGLASTTCLPGDICVDYNLPVLAGVSGQCRFVLEIFHNGSLVHTETSPFQTTGNNYCFTIDDCEVFIEDMYDYRIRVDCSVPAPPCPLVPPPVQNPIHLPVQYLGDDMTGAIPGQNNDIASCCINCCDSIKVVSAGTCCSKISSACEINSVKVYIQNGVASTFDWTCALRPNIYAFQNQSQFTVNLPSGCIPEFNLCVAAVFTDPYKPIIITYDITFANGKTCSVSDTVDCPCSVIKGTAWFDQNGDGIEQNNENGINGLKVQLWSFNLGKWIISETTFTGTVPGSPSDDGYYVFPCVKPGEYFVKFDFRGDLEVTLPHEGSDISVDSDITGSSGPFTTDNITINPGDTLCDIDAGFRVKTIPVNPVITISGQISTNDDTPMSGVNVDLYQKNGNKLSKTHTNQEGVYKFLNLPANSEYYTMAEFDGDPMQGVSTLDLVMIQRHILGIHNFDHPVKFIAADVNMSNSVTAADLVEIRKLILGINDNFKVNKSWRFVPKTLPYGPDKNPFPINDQLLISNMSGNAANKNFYAIKMGDVSGNPLSGALQPRTSPKFTLLMDDLAFNSGNELKIPVYASQYMTVSGLQFSLNVSEKLHLIGIEDGILILPRDQYSYKNNTLNVSLVTKKDIQITEGMKLFTLTFSAKSDGKLMENLTLNHNLVPELYLDHENTLPISLDFINPLNILGYELYPARPNPFASETSLEFIIPQDEVITFSIYNLDGKLILSKTDYYLKGKNQIMIKADELNQSGTYYVKMISNENTKVRKVIYLK